jgi:hypothetical protein
MQKKLNTIDAVTIALKTHGLLLKQDKQVPSVVSIITGESLRGSWWGHPQSHSIFSVLSALEDDPEVALTKLINRKDTFVHRRLWPALLAVGGAREAWQLQGLSDEGLKLLHLVDHGAGAVRATGTAAKALQVRLLVTAQQVHRDDGRHELALESWTAWSRRLGCKALRSSIEGRRELERATQSLGAPVRWLPWQSSV